MSAHSAMVTNLCRCFLGRVGRVLLAGLAVPAALAQTYSVNVLGYTDVTFAAGSNLVANPIFAADNSVSNLFRGLPDGSRFQPWNPSAGIFSPSNHFSSAAGWTAPAATFTAPQGGFLWLPSATTVSFVGQPWSEVPGPLCVTYPAGDVVSGWLPATICGLCSDLDGCPPFADYTTVLTWNPLTQSYNEAFLYLDGLGWFPSAPSLAAHEAAWLNVPESFSGRSPFAGSIGLTAPPTGLPLGTLLRPRRVGAELIFEWSAATNAGYSVFASTNLNDPVWRRVQQGVVTPTNGVATVVVPAAESSGYVRVLPNLGTAAVLLGGRRGAGTFTFQLHAPVGTNYLVERAAGPAFTSWQTVTNVTVEPGALIPVTDPAATGASARYRVRY